MANELGIIIEERLCELGWPLSRFVLESGLSADVVVDLVGLEQLPAMPDEHTLEQLSTALDLPFQQLVVAAGVACGLPRKHEAEPAAALRFATDQELLDELHRRLDRGVRHADFQRDRRAHLTLVKQVLAHEAS